MDFLILGSIWLAVAIIYFGGPAYLKQKGENLATRQDIGEITDVVEGIRRDYHEEIERLRVKLGVATEAMVRRRDVYERLTGSMRIFIQGQFPDANARSRRQQDFLDAYAASWLWAPDELIRAVNEFVQMNQRETAVDNARQRELKSAFFRVLLEMRKDAGFEDTGLDLDDLLFVQF